MKRYATKRPARWLASALAAIMLLATLPVTTLALDEGGKECAESMVDSTVLLNGVPMDDGSAFDVNDTLELQYRFEIPFEGENRPVAGDYLYLPLPDQFELVMQDNVDTVDFTAVDEDGNTGVIGTVSMVSDVTDADGVTMKRAAMITFNSSIDDWVSLGVSTFSAQLRYVMMPEDYEKTETTVTILDRTFVINFGSVEQADITLEKALSTADGALSPDPAISSDGIVWWRVTAAPGTETADLDGWRLLDTLPETLDRETVEVYRMTDAGPERLTLTDGSALDSLNTALTPETACYDASTGIFAYVFGNETEPVTFLLQTRVADETWYTQNAVTKNGTTTIRDTDIVNEAAMKKVGFQPVHAQAHATLSNTMLQKTGGGNGLQAPGAWTLTVNADGRSLHDVYVVDTMPKATGTLSGIVLAEGDAVLKNGAPLTRLAEKPQSPAGQSDSYFYDEPANRVFIYLGDIDSAVTLTVLTTLVNAPGGGGNQITNKAALYFSDFDTVNESSASSQKILKSGVSKTVLARPSYANGGEITWKLTANQAGIAQKDVTILDLMVHEAANLKGYTPDWNSLTVTAGADDDAAIQAIQDTMAKLLASPSGNASLQGGLTGGYLQLKAAPDASSTGTFIAVNGAGKTVTVDFACFALGDINTEKSVTVTTLPADGQGRSSWTNYAVMFAEGSYQDWASSTASVDGLIAKHALPGGNANVSGGTIRHYFDETAEGYNYETHQAEWVVRVNQGLKTGVPDALATVTDQLPAYLEVERIVAIPMAERSAVKELTEQAVELDADDWQVTGDITRGQTLTWSMEGAPLRGKCVAYHILTRVHPDYVEQFEAQTKKGVLSLKNSAEIAIGAFRLSASASYTLQLNEENLYKDMANINAGGEAREITWLLRANAARVGYDSAYVEDILPAGLNLKSSADGYAVRVWEVRNALMSNGKTETVRGQALDNDVVQAHLTYATDENGNQVLRFDFPDGAKGYELEVTTIFGEVREYNNRAAFYGNQVTVEQTQAAVAKATLLAAMPTTGVRLVRLTLHKIGESDRPLAGVRFALNYYGKTGEQLVDTVELADTDADGQVQVELYRFGYYSLTEVSAPLGYARQSVVTLLDQNGVRLADQEENGRFYVGRMDGQGNSVHLEGWVKNALIAGQVNFLKRDAAGSPLADAGFELRTLNGAAASSAVSDGRGQVVFSNVAAGVYRLYETAAPVGYEQLEEPLYQVTVSETGVVTYYSLVKQSDGSFTPGEALDETAPVVVNEAMGSLTVNGLKTLLGRTLQEGEFTFVLKDSGGNVVRRVQNGADGKFRFRLLFPKSSAGADRANAVSYTYYLSEEQGSLSRVTYDQTVYQLDVLVWLESDDILCEGTLTKVGEAAPLQELNVSFLNRYQSGGGTPPVTPVTPVTPDDPEIDIPDNETPSGDRPIEDETPPEPSKKPGNGVSEEEIIIVDGDVPLGNLPQTGTMAAPHDIRPMAAGLLGLALLCAAVSAVLTLRRRKDHTSF